MIYSAKLFLNYWWFAIWRGPVHILNEMGDD
jgi:hypothetical protein